MLPGYNVAATDPARYADWQLHSTRPMRHFHVGGNHLSLMIEPHVAQTAQCVQMFLREN
jgi:thioesterase domain-containing protein